MRTYLPLAVAALALAATGGCGKATSSSSGTGGTNSSGISFAAPTSASSVGGPYSVIVDDFNLDGKPDLVAAGSTASSCSYHRNTTSAGAGVVSFAGYAAIGAGTGPRACASADLNGDGLPDLVIANTDANTFTIQQSTTLPGSDTIAFSSATVGLAGKPQAVAFADMNADGQTDMVIARTDADIANVFVNNSTLGGAISFFGSPAALSTGSKPVAIAIGDLNGDGKPDVVTANMANSPSTIGTVTVFMNQTAAGANPAVFSLGISYDSGYLTDAVSVADINGDGRADIVATNYDSGTVSIFLNNTPPGATSPTFAAPVSYVTGTAPWGVVVRDLNGDGKPEIAVANAISNTISIFVNATPPGSSTLSFSARTDVASGTGPDAIVAADFNGDGKVDLATSCFNSSALMVHLNTSTVGASTVTFATASDVIHSSPRAVAVCDLHGNGNPDLVVATASTFDKAEIRLNETVAGATTPTFGSSAGFGVGDDPQSIAFADFNGDGKPDIATADATGNTVTLLLNSTAYPPLSGGPIPPPNFTAGITLTAPGSPRGIVIDDFNGDGKPDIAVACATGNCVSIFLRTTSSWPTLAFETRQDIALPAGSGPESLVAADFNRDGKIDIAVANRTTHTVSILRNKTAAAATPVTLDFDIADTIVLVGTAQPASLAADDLNGDGYPDLVTSNAGTNNVSVLLNRSPLSIVTPFTAPLPIAFDDATSGVNSTTGGSPQGLVLEDVNQDGRPDVVVANAGDGTVSVLLNVTAPGTFTPALAIKVDFATGAGARAVAAGDMNRDGKKDLAVANETAGTVSVLLRQ